MVKRKRSDYSGGSIRLKRRGTKRVGITGRAGRMRSLRRRSTYRKQRPRGFKNFASRAKWSGVNWPMTLYKKFEYEIGDLWDTGATNVSDCQAFRLNSLFDPAIGNSPNEQTSVTQFDEFLSVSGPYGLYRVLGAKVKIDMINVGGGTAMVIPILCGYQDTYWTPGQSFDTINDWTMLPGAGEPTYLGPATGSANRARKQFYVKPWQVIGVRRDQYMTGGNYSGNYTTNPATAGTAFLSFQCIGAGAPADAENAQAQVRFRVKIVYYAMLTNPVQAVRTVIGVDPDPENKDPA